MKKRLLIFFTIFFVFSCKTKTDSEKHFHDKDETKVYQLHLNPAPGSKYNFDINNESKINFEINDKKAEYINKADVSVYYQNTKDSLGNFLFDMSYGKIKLYSKNGDAETTMDAANAVNSIDPGEKMLGALRSANISATISPVGEVKSVNG